MATRKIIDAEQDGEKVWIKSHAKATFLSDGSTVEDVINNIQTGEGGITTETDPIFSASVAAKITNENITSWNNKVDKVDGKQLSTEDFTTLLKQKLDGLSNYDDTEISQAVSKLRADLDALLSGDTTTAIKTFNEVIAFLDGLEDTEDLASIIASIELQIAVKGTYSKPSSGIPKSDLASDVQTSLGKADTALQSVPSEYVTETELNNKGYATSSQLNSGFGNVEQKLQQINGELSNKQPTLVSGTNIKTINGTSVLGGGNIVISSGVYPLVNHGTNSTNFMLTPNVFHVWGEVTSLTLNFQKGDQSITEEYIFQFTSGTTATTLTLVGEKQWVNGEPNIEPNKTYQISIVNNIGLIVSV